MAIETIRNIADLSIKIKLMIAISVKKIYKKTSKLPENYNSSVQ